jgi:iron complex outermembrane receptor protein
MPPMKLRHTRISLAINAALLLALSPLAAQAQDAPATETETKTLDTLTVTGTRIKKSEVESQVPVQVLTREDIDRSGLTSVGDLIQELTASGSALNTKFNSSGNFGFSPNGDGIGAGSAQVDMRHLGAKRVLVLVDGIRWVNESSASGVGAATDLNTIPMALVERIEVLQDGASALYGSDAIAGVVNIITRRNFDGGQVSVQVGEYAEGDGATRSADIAWGFTNDRASLFLGLSYVDQETIFSRDREQSSFPVPGTGLAFASSATPNGRFIFIAPAPSDACPLTDLDENPATPDVAFCNITTPNGQFFSGGVDFPDDFIGFARANRFNFAQYNLLLTPSERLGGFGQFRFNINDDLQWYIKALANNRQSVNQAAPEPIFLGPDAGTGNPYADDITISALNPYNPFGFDLISSGPGANLILVGRRPVEGGPRVFEQDVDTQYVATGLNGAFDFGDRGYTWDANIVYARNQADQTNYGSYNIRNINLALGDPAVCAATPGCVPLNIFDGPGSITPAMLQWIQPVLHDESENTLFLASANISGDLFQLPAGMLAFAAGVEHRKYEGSYTPDPLNYVEVSPGVFENWYNGVPSLPTEGEYDVSELYLEVNAPLIDDGEGHKLDLSVAGRYSDYSTFGGEFTPKLGVRWQLDEQFVVRATYAEGFRAPSIGELFGSASRADLQIDDPCLIGVDGSAPEGNEANCDALGVPDGAAQSNSQISVTTGGNEDLEPERARSFTAGFVFSPTIATDKAWSDRLDFEVTYYRHDIEGAIQAIDAQTQLDLCVATLEDIYCNGITRSSVGSINGFANRLTNLGSIETSGWDGNVAWTLPQTVLGRFKVMWQNTWVGEYRAVGAAGQVQPRRVGEEVNDSGIPRWTSNVMVDWNRGNWYGSWTWRHISELTENCGDAAGFPGVCTDDANGRNTLNAANFNDAQLGYRFGVLKGLEVTAGVNNLFDEDPPICLSCSLNGYDASTYDAPGSRFYYLRMSVKF